LEETIKNFPLKVSPTGLFIYSWVPIKMPAGSREKLSQYMVDW